MLDGALDHQVDIGGLGHVGGEDQRLAADLAAAFPDADVFVTPSFTGFPVTFLEACLCGTPIVTTGRGDLLGWIDGAVGFNTEYTPEALADAIGRLLADDILRAKFGEQARELVRTRYNWQAIVRDIETFYAKVADNGAKPIQ